MARAIRSDKLFGVFFFRLSIALLFARLAVARHIEIMVGRIERNLQTGRAKIIRWDGDGEKYDDTTLEWTDRKCIDVDWLEPGEIFQAIKFFAYEVNPRFPFFLRRILIFGGLGCNPQNLIPEATINIENIDMVEEGKDLWLGNEKWQLPAWFCLWDTTYVHRPEGYFSIGADAHIENMDELDKLRAVDCETTTGWPDPRNYNLFSAWEEDVQCLQNELSRCKANKHLEEELNRGRAHEWDSEASWHDTLEEYASELTEFFDVVKFHLTGNFSLILESDFTRWHVGQVRDIWDLK